MATRFAWLLVLGGFAALAVGVGLGITLTVFTDDTRWNLALVTSVPLTMILLVPVVRALRKVP